MRIYTKTGDGGETGLFDGSRVAKDDLRVQAYGTADELNSTIGLLRCEGLDQPSDEELAHIQHDLFEIGSILATPGESPQVQHLPERIQALEQWMDRMDAELEPLRSFILPGGSRPAALAHLARTIARRAEREAWTCHRATPLPSEVLVYLNRLSDAFFMLARHQNQRLGTPDVAWQARS
jgi:cob(I)alamin adenosyltransferase